MTSFAEKLDHLFLNRFKPDGKHYTYAEVVATSEGRLTISHLSQLRNGTRNNPTYEVIQALVNVFGVEPNYFFDVLDTEGEEPKLQVLEEDVLEIALRARNLDEDGKFALKSILDFMEGKRKKPKRRETGRDES